jgi:hypothetical protein
LKVTFVYYLKKLLKQNEFPLVRFLQAKVAKSTMSALDLVSFN